MRTFYVCLIFLICFPSMVQAQVSRWNFGLKASMGWSGHWQSDRINQEVTDDYQPGFSYSAGMRVRYQISNRFALCVDAEAQYLCDRRVRTVDVMGLFDGLGPLVYTNDYSNTFNRVQVPLLLQYKPLRKQEAFYLTGGVMLGYLFNAKTEATTYSSRNTTTWEQSIQVFDVPANQHLHTPIQWVAGFGTVVRKRLALELTYQFGKMLRYDAFDPGQTDIGVPVYSSKVNQGLMLSVTYQLTINN